MRAYWITLLLLLGSMTQLFAQFSMTDTLVCGDTLIASFDPAQQHTTTDSFYVWIGNCPSKIRFDFTTASIPDAADIFYMDIQGNSRPAGSVPYFGGNCNGGNHFSDPTRYPPATALTPQNCLPGFVELYGAGIPLQDSIRQRNQLPNDFKLGGGYWESARLHLDIPEDIVALLFVVKFNPNQSTVLRALWDCEPQCCITAQGDSVCAGDSLQVTTLEEAIAYSWTGPNGFSSQERSPIIPDADKSATGWYVVEAEYLFGCTGTDSVYVEVLGPEISITPDSVWICLGGQTTLEAQGASNFEWDLSATGILSTQSSTALVSPQVPTRYLVRTEDAYGCTAEASAMVIPQSLEATFMGKAASCPGLSDGSITANTREGQAPFSIRLQGGNWQSGKILTGLQKGTYQIELKDAAGCSIYEEVEVPEAESVSAAIGEIAPSCVGREDGEIAILPMEGQAPFTFYIDNHAVDSLITGISAGTYQVEMSDIRGCYWSKIITIEDPAPFRVDLGRDKKVREGKEIRLKVEASESILDIMWPGYCEDNCQEELTWTADSSEYVYVEAWNSAGCYAQDSVFIQVKKKAECAEGIYAPTAFTPNGDGVNDRFGLFADSEETDVAHISQLIIFNKWGKVVWSKSSLPFNAPELGWDGYSGGKKLQEGTYTWAGSFIREDGLSFKCGGSVILIR